LNGLWLATPLDDLLQRTNHPCRGQRWVDVNPQPFAIEVIEDIEQPEAATIGLLVVHEVH